jgi:Aminoglycoside N3''-acetyltransferase
MSEWDAIRRSKAPVTRSLIVNDLRKLGIEAGMTVIVHSSMKRIGWICGGAVTVIEALQEVLTLKGTLVMPAHSADVSDPGDWDNPPVPKGWLKAIYDEMPPFDPDRTPTFGIGRVAETFRKFPGVERSGHPIYSFSAWGAHSREIISGHDYDDGMGNASPLGSIYRLNGCVLLIGVGFDKNTSMHLGEYQSKRYPQVTRQSPVLVNGERRWVSYRDRDYHEELFPAIGHAFEREMRGKGTFCTGKIGQATSVFMPQRAIVDFTADYLLRKSKR